MIRISNESVNAIYQKLRLVSWYSGFLSRGMLYWDYLLNGISIVAVCAPRSDLSLKRGSWKAFDTIELHLS